MRLGTGSRTPPARPFPGGDRAGERLRFATSSGPSGRVSLWRRSLPGTGSERTAFGNDLRDVRDKCPCSRVARWCLPSAVSVECALPQRQLPPAPVPRVCVVVPGTSSPPPLSPSSADEGLSPGGGSLGPQGGLAETRDGPVPLGQATHRLVTVLPGARGGCGGRRPPGEHGSGRRQDKPARRGRQDLRGPPVWARLLHESQQ